MEIAVDVEAKFLRDYLRVDSYLLVNIFFLISSRFYFLKNSKVSLSYFKDVIFFFV